MEPDRRVPSIGGRSQTISDLSMDATPTTTTATQKHYEIMPNHFPLSGSPVRIGLSTREVHEIGERTHARDKSDMGRGPNPHIKTSVLLHRSTLLRLMSG